MIRKLLKYHLPLTLSWAIVVLVLSGIPGSSLPHTGFFHFKGIDKVVHFIMYSTLAFLIMNSFSLQKKSSAIVKRRIILAFCLALGYGIFMEILQATIFSGRSAEFADVLANTCGCIFGIIIYKITE